MPYRRWIALVALALSAGMPVAAAPDAPAPATTPLKTIAFDFGSDEPDQVAPGFIGVCEKDFYAKAKGYGWRTHLQLASAELQDAMNKAMALNESQVADITPFKSKGEILKMLRLGVPLLGSYNNRNSVPDRYNQSWGVKIRELDTLLNRDYVIGSRIYGFYYDPRIRQECLETRGSIFIDDDLSTEFLVDLPNGDYTVLIGMGDNKHAHYRLSPFHVAAQGVTRLKENAPTCLVRRRIEDIQVRDGQLNLRIFVDRNQAATHPWPWNVFATWTISYLVVMPAKDTDAILAKEQAIERDHYEHLKQVVFVGGERTETYVRDGCFVVNDKPLYLVSMQNFPGVLSNFSNDIRHYPYYGFTNCIGILARRMLSSAHFLQSRWQERSYYDDYPFDTIGRLNDAYEAGFLTRLSTAQDFLNFMPRYLQNESAGMEDSKGNSLGRAPLNSELSRELTREAYVMISAHIKDHPALTGYEVWDEMPHMGIGFGHDVKSVAEYRAWLEKKYGAIGALNAEWETNFKDFSDVAPPKQMERSASLVNFYRFVSDCMSRQVIETHDVLKKLEPFHVTHGGKGQGTGVEDNSWGRAPAAEVLRVECGLNVGRAACERLGHALEANGMTPGCKWAYFYPGVKRLGERKPPPDAKRYMGEDSRSSGYSAVLRRMFDGAKSNWWEEYNDPADHAFHRAKVARDLAGKGRIRRWSGDLVFFEEGAYDQADVSVCPGYLELARAHQLAYRLGPLFLPARPPKGEVATLLTEQSFIPVGRPAAYTSLQHHQRFDDFLKSLQVPQDVIREEIFDEIANYKVVVLGPWSAMLYPDEAKKLADFVAKGGSLVLLHDAAAGDARNLREPDTSPVMGLDAVAGFSRTKGRWTVTADAQVVAGTTQSPTAIRGKDGRVWWFDFNALIRSDADTLRKHFRDVFARAKVQPTLSLDADKSPETLDADVLVNRDVALVGVSTVCAEDQKVTLRMHFLKPGRYDVVDVTGERPKTRRDEFNSEHLAADPDYRHSWYVARDASAEDLAAKGVALDVQARAGRVLAVRPSGAKVWVDAPEYELRGILLQERRFAQRAEGLRVTVVPARIVLPDGASPQLAAAAEKLAATLKAANVDAIIVPPGDVRTRTDKHDVLIQYDGSDPSPTAAKYLVDTFVTEPVEGDANLIVLGSEATNPVAAHLGKVGAFAYDKVLEKVTPAYPGPGRGILQVVDSVNSPVLDPRHSTRDAVLVGGSDDAGTLAAAEKLLEILRPADPKEAKP